jgi:hypothetical protein
MLYCSETFFWATCVMSSEIIMGFFNNNFCYHPGHGYIWWLPLTSWAFAKEHFCKDRILNLYEKLILRRCDMDSLCWQKAIISEILHCTNFIRRTSLGVFFDELHGDAGNYKNSLKKKASSPNRCHLYIRVANRISSHQSKALFSLCR